jgi:PAS domain S-box-containing protein
MTDTKILIVEDEVIVARNIEKRLISAGYKVAGFASSAEEAIELAASLKPDLVLMDIKLKGKMDGIDAANAIRKSYRLPIIYLTSYADEETFQRAKITEPFGYLIKPFELKELKRTVEMALYKNKINNELLENQQRYEIAVHAGKTGVWEFWPNENKYFSDENLKALYGFKEDELSDNSDDWSNLVYEEDRAEMDRKFQNFLTRNDNEFLLEHRIYKKNGSIGWVIDRGVLFQPNNEKPLRLIGTTTDITEFKEAELALIKSEERFRNTFENAGIGMAILAPDGRFTKVNNSFCEMIAYKAPELLQMYLREITHPADLEKTMHMKEKLLKNKSEGSRNLEIRYTHKSDETIWTSTTLSLVRDFEEKPLYFISQVQDITIRKKAEEQLERYADELNSLNKSKDKFFSIISHDLRSPFNALLGITEYMAEYYKDMNPDEVKDSVNNIYRSSTKLYNLILNLLEWSRLHTGRMEVEKTSLNLNEAGNEALNLLNENATAKKIDLINKINKDIYVTADKYMIDTVLRNLISNSIKFTKPGGHIILSAVQVGNMVEISVEDNGIGISEENQKKIFRIDAQYHREGTANEKGTGLGLILCKEFVEKNNGTIRIESRENEGSKFIFTIPLSTR